MRGEANMDQCPMCLGQHASMKNTRDGFGGGSVSAIPAVYCVTCRYCIEYYITDDAIDFLKRCDGMRRRAVEDMCKQGFIGQNAGKEKNPAITSKMLQDGYWKQRMAAK